MADNNTIEELTETEEIITELSADVIKKDEKSIAKTYDKYRRRALLPSRHQRHTSDDHKSSDEGSLKDESEDEDSFDTFVLRSFNPFSGIENVIEWLDETDEKFNNLNMPRTLRYAAIPLLVKGAAKRTYISNTKSIKCYDDFYSLLLEYYDVSNQINHHQIKSQPPPPSSFQKGHISDTFIQKSVVFDDQPRITTGTFELSDSLPAHPVLRSTAIFDRGATGLAGDDSVNRSNIVTSNSTTVSDSPLDQTTYALRRAIVDSLIKTPKTFRGGKEDVKQWLEDIEQLFDTAQIPESHKLDLVQYSLRGEAARWFKHNKTSLTSSDKFVKGLKEIFLSPCFAEVAFKKLEAFTQGVNQPIRSFYNETLKLCLETDPSMSDVTKLRTLLNKTKPALQLEIRKKKPTTTKQFLEYAIEIEDLYQLSNIDLSKTATDDNNIVASVATTLSSTRPYKTPINYNATTPSASHTETIHNNNNNYNNRNNIDSNRFPQPSSSYIPNYRSKQQPNNSWRMPYESPTSYPPSNRNQQASYPNPNQSSFNNYPKQKYRSNYNQYDNSYNNNNNQPKHSNPTPRANNISISHIPSLLDPFQPPSPPVICSRCQRSGHEASACSRF